LPATFAIFALLHCKRYVMSSPYGMLKMADSRPVNRPLSPHLQVYRPMLTMMMSIMHRITGVALYFGVILFVWWLTAAAYSDSYFALVQGFFASWFGRLVMFGFTWALIHHAIGGLRHFIWDMGRGFDLAKVEWMARANLAGSIALTVLLWVVAYGVKP
jgi:succinate dehydrogenase / fumarate reductase, cytochrome b subunit